MDGDLGSVEEVELIAPPDPKLNALAERVDAGFARVDADLQALRSEIAVRDAAFEARFGRLEERFDRLNGLLLKFCFGVLGSIVLMLVGGILGLLFGI